MLDTCSRESLKQRGFAEVFLYPHTGFAVFCVDLGNRESYFVKCLTKFKERAVFFAIRTDGTDRRPFGVPH